MHPLSPAAAASTTSCRDCAVALRTGVPTPRAVIFGASSGYSAFLRQYTLHDSFREQRPGAQYGRDQYHHQHHPYLRPCQQHHSQHRCPSPSDTTAMFDAPTCANPPCLDCYYAGVLADTYTGRLTRLAAHQQVLYHDLIAGEARYPILTKRRCSDKRQAARMRRERAWHVSPIASLFPALVDRKSLAKTESMAEQSEEADTEMQQFIIIF
ncbi:hypothetical protein MSAN_01751700 [Mycena sanguinolenta]|uniref:Uncharacterized protein n=1 Tax=Mycena sanguinolenta TaxID=230812 RepID=A0A8H7CU07_9AGAR|nr:hypothetical protein MSAN_01751700 [Mycena sanguinolenta]